MLKAKRLMLNASPRIISAVLLHANEGAANETARNSDSGVKR
jgi:hypothetical protein